MPPKPLLSPCGLRSIALMAALLVGLTSAMVALSYVVRLDIAAWLAASAATAAMVRWTASVATRQPGDATDAIARCLAWGLAMGVLNVGVAFCAAMVMSPSFEPRSLVLAPLAMLVGAPAGMGLGVVFGAGLIVPVAAVLVASRRGTPAAFDGASAVVGLWVTAMVAFVAMVPEPGATAPMFGMWPHEVPRALDPMQQIWVRGICLVAGLGGISLTMLALDRAAARRRFVRDVARGRVPGWQVTAASCGALLPCLGPTPERCDLELHRVEEPGEGAYRRAETSWPVARVPAGWVGR